MEYHVRLRFRVSPLAFQMKSRICILCSFVVQNLNIFCQLFDKAIRPAAAPAIYFFRDLQRVCAVVQVNFLGHRGSPSF